MGVEVVVGGWCNYHVIACCMSGGGSARQLILQASRDLLVVTLDMKHVSLSVSKDDSSTSIHENYHNIYLLLHVTCLKQIIAHVKPSVVVVF